MTRSTARRSNLNARRIVALIPSRQVQGSVYIYGPFGDVSARKFAMEHVRDRELLTSEVNWSLAAEMMNRRRAPT